MAKKKTKADENSLISEKLLNRARDYSKQKSLGQNFLVSEKILQQIVEVSKLDAENHIVIEIGTGIGFLTEILVKHAYHVYGIELDEKTVPFLERIQAKNPNFSFIRKDILSLSVEDILSKEHFEAVKSKTKTLKIVANIPYQISSMILVHFLGEVAESNINRPFVSEINILVQKEFAERLTARPGTKAYGSLTILLNYWAELEYCLDVPKEVFDPSPKVDSAFVKIKLRQEPLVEIPDPKLFRRFVKAIFVNRRKVLTNGLKAAGFSEEEIKRLNLETNLRGETLTIEEIARLIVILGSAS